MIPSYETGKVSVFVLPQLETVNPATIKCEYPLGIPSGRAGKSCVAEVLDYAHKTSGALLHGSYQSIPGQDDTVRRL